MFWNSILKSSLHLWSFYFRRYPSTSVFGLLLFLHFLLMSSIYCYPFIMHCLGLVWFVLETILAIVIISQVNKVWNTITGTRSECNMHAWYLIKEKGCSSWIPALKHQSIWHSNWCLMRQGIDNQMMPFRCSKINLSKNLFSPSFSFLVLIIPTLMNHSIGF